MIANRRHHSEVDGSQDWAYRRVATFLALGVGRDPASISLDEALSSFETDSLELVEFTMELEDELGQDLPEIDLRSVKTVGDLVDSVRSLRA